MSATPRGAATAALQGCAATLRAPGMLIGVLLLTIVSVVPFVFPVQSAVLESLALNPEAANVGGSEIDPEWWLEFRRHASGLAATFTPAILGFAAPLDTFSALLDGTRQPVMLLLPIALSAVLWAFIWGGALNRFARNERSFGAFVRAGFRYFVPLLAVTAIAATASLFLYLTVHALLLGVVYDAIAGSLASEPAAFAVRVLLYAVFGGVLVAANAVFAFARIGIVGSAQGVSMAIRDAWSFVRSRAVSVGALYGLFILLIFVTATAYGVGEIYGGSRVGGWRAVVIGQAFIGFRLAMRLALAAAQVRLAAGR